MVLPLQKLVHLHSDSDCGSDCSDAEQEKIGRDVPKKKRKNRGTFPQSMLPKSIRLARSRTAHAQSLDPGADHHTEKGFVTAHVTTSTKAPVTQVRTLQRYHGGPNEERIDFMERHSALASKNLGVTVEQVSIFLTADHTVISFFESSAEDIESPILARLGTPETILRRSSDASMLTQVSASYSHLVILPELIALVGYH